MIETGENLANNNHERLTLRETIDDSFRIREYSDKAQENVIVREHSTKITIKQVGGGGGGIGPQGLSAYEIAIKNGFQGTELQWLSSLTNTSSPNPSSINFFAKAGNVNGIGGHRVVYLDQNSKAQYATNMNISICNKTIGITINSSLYLSDCEIVTSGLVKDPSFSFIIDNPIYLIDNGIISQTYSVNAPTCKVLGFAFSIDSFWLDINQTIIKG